MNGSVSPEARIDAYAAGIFELAKAEGDADHLGDELFRVAQALDDSEPLRDALTDTRIPVDRKQGIIDELLGTRASTLAVSLVNFVVAQGRAGDLGSIARRLLERAAEERASALAEVRSAIELDDETVRRLEERLAEITGRRVEAKVVVDPSVLGGVVAKVGDTIFDGSVKSRLQELREAWVANG